MPRPKLTTTRKEASEAGLTRYWTGKSCKWGHVAERLVSNGRCIKCMYELRTELLRDNPEERRRRSQRQLESIRRDPRQAQMRNIRSHICVAIRRNDKSGKIVDALGCSIDEFKAHLESQFEPGMTWDNWSRDGWHIDHIEPLSSFDLSDSEQYYEALHYTNCRPMWAIPHLRRNAYAYFGC